MEWIEFSTHNLGDTDSNPSINKSHSVYPLTALHNSCTAALLIMQSCNTMWEHQHESTCMKYKSLVALHFEPALDLNQLKIVDFL